jgi:hypothetical protein
MPIDERDEQVGHREAEHAVKDERGPSAPVSDRPVEEPVERRPAELEQTPAVPRD